MISPTRNELIASFAGYIRNATGLAEGLVIRGKQNAPAPTDTYCTLLYVTDTAAGLSSKTLTEETQDTLKYRFNAFRHYVFSVQFYRDNATNLAKQLMLYHETPAGIEYQQTAQFGVKDIVAVEEAAEVISQNYEQRAILSIDLNVNEIQEVIINRVKSVDFTLLFDVNSDTLQENLEVLRDA